MQDQTSPAGFELPQLIVSQHGRENSRADSERDGGLGSLREVPGLPFRFSRHLTAWVVWHTSRVSLLPDRAPAELRERSQH